MVRRLLIILLAAPLCVGCPGDPEEKSGGDGYRHQAQPIELGPEWVVDEISAGALDTTDWKKIELTQPARVVIELNADVNDAELLLGVYTRYGQLIAKKLRTRGLAKLAFDADKPGYYFFMIRHQGGDATGYQVRAIMAGDSGSGGGDGPW